MKYEINQNILNPQVVKQASMNETTTDEWSVDQGIDLALDPNLITLPLSSENVDGEKPKKAEPSGSLINNPYEIYGQMPLPHLIPLILSQRGIPFRDLSESTGPPPPTHDDEGEGEEEEEVPKRDDGISHLEFNGVRSKMVEDVDVALNESSLALETVSLLLSAHNGPSSMSPFLKQSVPIGSLNSDMVPRERDDPLTMVRFNVGWKLRCLERCRLVVKESVDLLKGDLIREHVYWRKIVRYVNNNDVLFKMRDKSAGQWMLGLKYGYYDSGSEFRHDRGMAVLRNDVERDVLELVPVSGNGEKNGLFNGSYIRVRVFIKIESEDDFILSGESRGRTRGRESMEDEEEEEDILPHEDIRGQIQRLKDIIFDKELMHQLKKESGVLISYGVHIENENKIVIELPDEKFEIEMIYREEEEDVDSGEEAAKINDKRANLVLVMLRMLLTVQFKKNLLGRLSVRGGRKSGECLLIRPLLSKLRFCNYEKLLKKVIKENVLDFLPDANVQERDDSGSREQQQHTSRLMDRHLSRLTKEIGVFHKILTPPKKTFEIVSGASRLNVTLSLPNYCTAKIDIQYLQEQADDDGTLTDKSFNSTFTEFKEVEEFLHFLVTEFMVGGSGGSVM